MGRSPFLGAVSHVFDKASCQSPLLDSLLESVEALASLSLPNPSVPIDDYRSDLQNETEDETKEDTLSTGASAEDVDQTPLTPVLSPSDPPAVQFVPVWCYLEANDSGGFVATPLSGYGEDRLAFDRSLKEDDAAGPSEALLLAALGPISPDAFAPEWKGHRDVVPTTIVLYDLPALLTQSVLLETLDRAGFCGLYDFVFLPTDVSTGESCGYAVVNLRQHAHGLALAARLHGFVAWGEDAEGSTPCKVAWSHPLQGLADSVYAYRSHPLNDESVDEELRPQLFSRGWRVPFPGSMLPSC